jgi:hypothetical protein
MRKESGVESRSRIPLLGEKLPEIRVPTALGVEKIAVNYAGKWLTSFQSSSRSHLNLYDRVGCICQ